MLKISPIPAFADNYIWLLEVPGQAGGAVVDPGDAVPVQTVLDQRGLTLEAMLITHHHRDHIGGAAALLGAYPECRVFGPEDGRIPGLTDIMREGDEVVLSGLNAAFQVLEVPGHTSSHIAYLGSGGLFCGDTLFAAGCGRVFDGSFEQLAASLRRIAGLSGDTLAYCAHEYTLDNLGFAKWVEPDSPELAAREQAERLRRDAGEPTVPSSLALEAATNPFLRTGEARVIAAAEAYVGHSLSGHAQVFRALREWKDREYD